MTSPTSYIHNDIHTYTRVCLYAKHFKAVARQNLEYLLVVLLIFMSMSVF